MSDEEAEIVLDECIAFAELAIEAWRLKHKHSREEIDSARDEHITRLISDY